MLITLQNYTLNYIAVVNEWLENLPQSVPRFCSCMDRCINYNYLPMAMAIDCCMIMKLSPFDQSERCHISKV